MCPAPPQKKPTTQAASGDGGAKKTGVLFVCLGNICRSPTAEAVFRAAVQRAGLDDAFDIDSCGTGGGATGWYKSDGFSYHEGGASGACLLSLCVFCVFVRGGGGDYD